MLTVAVLFARLDSIYKTLPGCDVYDAERDARTWPGGAPVVAHPPCRLWASLRTKAKADPSEKNLAHFAIEQVRTWGGVVEHPWLSTLWDEYALRPARRRNGGMMSRDQWGFLLPTDLFSFGYPAKKKTGLYICGVDPYDLPAKPLRLGEPTHTIGLWSGRDRATCKPSIAKSLFDATPLAMAEWLVDVARRTRVDALRAA